MSDRIYIKAVINEREFKVKRVEFIIKINSKVIRYLKYRKINLKLNIKTKASLQEINIKLN